jgi:hypothetical protein
LFVLTSYEIDFILLAPKSNNKKFIFI